MREIQNCVTQEAHRLNPGPYLGTHSPSARTAPSPTHTQVYVFTLLTGAAQEEHVLHPSPPHTPRYMRSHFTLTGAAQEANVLHPVLPPHPGICVHTSHLPVRRRKRMYCTHTSAPAS